MTPNPGSDAALKLHCSCAVLDNGHGIHPPMRGPNGEPQWWVTGGCPLHAPKRPEAKENAK